MKKLITCGLFAIMSLAVFTGCGKAVSGNSASSDIVENKTETPAIEGYNLLWADEFDGNKLLMKIYGLWKLEKLAGLIMNYSHTKQVQIIYL